MMRTWLALFFILVFTTPAYSNRAKAGAPTRSIKNARPVTAQGAPLSRWAVAEVLKDLGYKNALEDGRIKIATDHRVSIVVAGQMHFDGTIATRGDLANLLRVVRKNIDDRERATSTPVRSLETVRATDFENHVNDRGRTGTGVPLVSGIVAEFSGGRPFSLPVVELAKDRGEILSVGTDFPGISQAIEQFQRPDGTVLMPVHPQEMPFRGFGKSVNSIRVRNASSERTVHSDVRGIPEALLKLPLSNIEHSGVKRPIPRAWAKEVIGKTRFLLEWAKNLAPDSPFAFMPEPMAIVDREADSAVVVRSQNAYPPLPNKAKTWSVPLYSLWAKDEYHAKPLMIRLIENRPDQSVDPVTYAIQRIIRPMIENSLTLHVDLGASAQDHPQNTHLELDVDGQPTGRIINSDLEDLVPYAPLAAEMDSHAFAEKYQTTSLQEVDTVKAQATFSGYFVDDVFWPVLETLQTNFSQRADELRSRVYQALKDGLARRKVTIDRFKDSVTKDFQDDSFWRKFRQKERGRRLALGERDLERTEKTLGPEHPELAARFERQADVYRELQIDPSWLLERALAIKEKTLGPDHPDVATSLEKLAAVHRVYNRPEAAEAMEARAGRIRASARK